MLLFQCCDKRLETINLKRKKVLLWLAVSPCCCGTLVRQTGRNRSGAVSGPGTATVKGQLSGEPVELAWSTLWSWVRKPGFYSVKGLNLGLWRGNRTEERGQKCHPETRAWDCWAQEGHVWLGIPASALCIVILEFYLQLPKTSLPQVLVDGTDRSQAFLMASLLCPSPRWLLRASAAWQRALFRQDMGLRLSVALQFLHPWNEAVKPLLQRRWLGSAQ